MGFIVPKCTWLLEVKLIILIMIILLKLSWPENQGILFFLYFSNIANEPDIFHGFPP